MSRSADVVDIVQTHREPVVGQIFSDAIYDACDTPVSHDANPATMGAIVDTEKKIFIQIELLLTQIKGLREDELKEMLDKFISIYRNSFERCVFLPEPEGCEEADPHAAIRHHLSLRLDQWNEWFADKGVDRTWGRRFKDPNSKNKARMEGDEAAGLEEMKQRILQIERDRLYEAELQKYQADQEKLGQDPSSSKSEASRAERERQSEARRYARAERAKDKKRQKDIDFLKTITLECAVGYVDSSTLVVYKAKCHLCEDRLTDPKYMIVHEKIKHPMMFFCHYCDRTFAAHGPMRVHCETVHLGLPIDPPGRRPPERANCTKGPSAHPPPQVPDQVELNREQPEPIPPDPAPVQPKPKTSRTKSPRRSRVNAKKKTKTEVGDKLELAACSDEDKAVAKESTKKRPIAVVAPMTKTEAESRDTQRPGPSGGARRSRRVRQESATRRNETPGEETTTIPPVETQDNKPAAEQFSVSHQQTVDTIPASVAANHAPSEDDGEVRSYPRKGLLQRSCSLPPYSLQIVEKSDSITRSVSDNDLLTLSASRLITGIDQVLKTFGLSGSSSSSGSDDSSDSSGSDEDVSSTSSSDSGSEPGYNDRLVKFIASQPSTAKAMAAFLEKEKQRAKKREATYAQGLLRQMYPSMPAEEDSASTVVLPQASASTELSQQQAIPTNQPQTSVPNWSRPVVVPRGKMRASMLLAKMKEAARAREEDPDGEDSDQSSSTPEEPCEKECVQGDSSDKKDVSNRASQLLASMKRAAQARAEQSWSDDTHCTDAEEHVEGSATIPPKNRVNQLLASMRKAAMARADNQESDSSDSEESVSVGIKSESENRGASVRNRNKSRRGKPTAKRTHPVSTDGESSSVSKTLPPVKRNRRRTRKTAA